MIYLINELTKLSEALMTKSAYARNKPKHSLCGKCDRYRSYCEYIAGLKSPKRTRCPDFKLGLKQTPKLST